MTENTLVTNYKRSLLLVASSSVLLAILGTFGVLFWAGWLTPPANQQAMVHYMGHQVMPFDLSQTHIFSR